MLYSTHIYYPHPRHPGFEFHFAAANDADAEAKCYGLDHILKPYGYNVHGPKPAAPQAAMVLGCLHARRGWPEQLLLDDADYRRHYSKARIALLGYHGVSDEERSEGRSLH